ncbi:MAG: heavy metal translocating P-type ATPase [Deltaproteobacteria bacterium]|nr:MAG: heavy metal translocating P-type ATPase [Deltaproteobacteria bacterium]
MQTRIAEDAPMKILHELPKRLRIQNPLLHDPELDPPYLEAMLMNIDGVTSVRINVKAACAIVGYDGRANTREAILALMGHLPPAVFLAAHTRIEEPDPVGTSAKVLTALATHFLPQSVAAPISAALALPHLLEGGDTLVTEGVKVEVLDAAAIAFSLMRQDYFTTNAIVAMLALGEYMEQTSEHRSTELLKSLLRPQVEAVWVERNGQEIRVAADEVHIGDHVICGAGELIPVDGTVTEGEALVNQSSITGESVPVHTSPGDDVPSGAVVVEGRIKIEARQVGSDTGMARIGRFLENSLRYKSKSQKASDELADRLVPITFGLGILGYLFSRDVKRAASVLTVDYSCAIKLANPVAVRMSMYAAARAGVLLKGADAMDRMARVDTLVFDKTGTLTRGALQVTDILTVEGLSADALLSIAAGAEAHYSHPVADAVVHAAQARNLTLPTTAQVDFIVAHGVSAYVDGRRVLVGSFHFIGEDEGIDCSALNKKAYNMRRQGKSLLYVAREGELLGIIALRDDMRAEAPAVLDDLKKQGVKKIVVLTGDHRTTAKAVCEGIDAIDEIHWELKPEDKARIVGELQAAGHKIAFAGDGVNDAPALVTADVGICMPGGADLAKESAQVVLLKDDLALLAIARRISTETQQTIRNCFNTTIGLNTLILLMASTGRLEPVTSALLHNMTTLGILGYAAASGASRGKTA